MTLKKLLVCFCAISVSALGQKDDEVRYFPENFQFGVATASYQIEGGWNASGKGENIWDRFSHTTEQIVDRSTGDVACDSYNLFSRDVEMIKELGMDYYRFSLSWSRILPDGTTNKINEDGLRYYNALIDELISANITPTVTLYHWDLPQALQELHGGWPNPKLVDYFADYARVVFEAFGDRVKTWLTFNEPFEACHTGYGTEINAPGTGISGIDEYLCTHTVLKAHAAAYHLYDEVFKPIQKGRVSLTLSAEWMEPESDSDADIEAAERSMQFYVGWYANPIFSKEGDYPKVMKDRIKQLSLEEGYPESRLPEFTPEEIDYIKGTSDFFGVNHYSTIIVRESSSNGRNKEGPSFDNDLGVEMYLNQSWPGSASSWLKVVPWGFYKTLKWINDAYGVMEIKVFECGFSDTGVIDDELRTSYYHDYLNAMLDAIEDGCVVTAFTAWSLMDNFEWSQGYTEHFGLYLVNFTEPTKTRTPKMSTEFFKRLTATRKLERSIKK